MLSEAGKNETNGLTADDDNAPIPELPDFVCRGVCSVESPRRRLRVAGGGGIKATTFVVVCISMFLVAQPIVTVTIPKEGGAGGGGVGGGGGDLLRGTPR